jgi:hypothetical protein
MLEIQIYMEYSSYIEGKIQLDDVLFVRLIYNSVSIDSYSICSVSSLGVKELTIGRKIWL